MDDEAAPKSEAILEFVSRSPDDIKFSILEFFCADVCKDALVRIKGYDNLTRGPRLIWDEPVIDALLATSRFARHIVEKEFRQQGLLIKVRTGDIDFAYLKRLPAWLSRYTLFLSITYPCRSRPQPEAEIDLTRFPRLEEIWHDFYDLDRLVQLLVPTQPIRRWYKDAKHTASLLADDSPMVMRRTFFLNVFWHNKDVAVTTVNAPEGCKTMLCVWAKCRNMERRLEVSYALAPMNVFSDKAPASDGEGYPTRSIIKSLAS
jgi:hypothetical protein